MKEFLYFITLICFLFFTACQNDDIPALPDSNQSTKDSIEHVRALKEYRVLSALCNAEEQPDRSWQYTPTYGEVLYTATPTIRYVAVDDLQEAKDLFSYMFINALDPTETVDMTPDDITYRIEGKGYLRFSTSSDEKKQIACVEVNFPIVPDLKEIVFISKDRWPNNDISMLRYGAVYMDKDTKYRFVCIADTKSGDGILITFDGKKSIVKNGDIVFENWESEAKWGKIDVSAKTFFSEHFVHMCKGMPDYGVFSKLSKFLYTTIDQKGNRRRNEQAVRIFLIGTDDQEPICPEVYSSNYSNYFLAYSSSPEDWKWIHLLGDYYYYTTICRSAILTPPSKQSTDPEPIEYRWKLPFNKNHYIPSLAVTVSSSFNPKDHGLEMIEFTQL